MSYRAIFVVLVCIMAPVAAVAQAACGTDVPISVIRANGEPIPGLKASDFNGQLKKQALAIESLSYDVGPRRILFVIDTTRQLTADARRAEVEFASAMVSAAQPGDSFALLTARGIEQSAKFAADRSAVNQALKVLEQSAGENLGDTKKAGVLDAVAEGIGWFGEPRLGDAIVVFARDLEDNHKTDYKKVARMLAERHIRLYGVAFGHLLLNNSTSAAMATSREGLGYVQPGIVVPGELGDANFFPLSINSGGYLVREDQGLAQKQFKLDELKRKQLQKTGALMAQLVDEFYRVRVNAPAHAEPLTVGLKQSQPGSYVLYPLELECGRQ